MDNPTINPTIRRRKKEQEKLKTFAEKISGRVKIVASAGNPPYEYILAIQLPIYLNTRNQPRLYEGPTILKIVLPEDHPLSPPVVVFTDPIPYSPNVKPDGLLKGAVCWHTHWRPDYYWLDKVLLNILEIATLNRFSLEKNSLNPEACTFVRSHLADGLLPTMSLKALQGEHEASREKLAEEIELA